MKGDLIDLQNSLLGTADHNVQMMTDGTLALIPIQSIVDIAFRFPAVGMAMWYETLVEGSIFREWILNVGRRDAFTAIAHLLCEFAMTRSSSTATSSPDRWSVSSPARASPTCSSCRRDSRPRSGAPRSR